MIEGVGILVPTDYGQHAGTQDVRYAVRHQQRIARVIDQRGEPVGDADLGLDGAEQQDPAVGGELLPYQVTPRKISVRFYIAEGSFQLRRKLSDGQKKAIKRPGHSCHNHTGKRADDH